MPDKQPLTATLDYHGSRLEVREVASGWRASYRERIVEDPQLDLALGRVLGWPPGATLSLIQRLFAGDSAV